jgi:hypothetical protein
MEEEPTDDVESNMQVMPRRLEKLEESESLGDLRIEFEKFRRSAVHWSDLDALSKTIGDAVRQDRLAAQRQIDALDQSRRDQAATQARMKADLEQVRDGLTVSRNDFEVGLDAKVDRAILDQRVDARIDERLEDAADSWREARLRELFKPSDDMNVLRIEAAAEIDDDARRILTRMSELAHLGSVLFEEWAQELRMRPATRVEEALSASGRRTLLPDVLELVSAMEAVSFESLLWRWWLGDAQVSPWIVSAVRRRWPQEPLARAGAQKLGLAWAEARAPRIQATIEALPVELDGPDDAGVAGALCRAAARLKLPISPSDDAVSSARQLSGLFHTSVKELYRLLGAEYFQVRLYDDHTKSPDVARFMQRKSGCAYPFTQSDTLQKTAIPVRHGVIVRIGRPLRRLTGSAGEEWDGVFEYFEQTEA